MNRFNHHILFLSAPIGSGHTRAAQAVAAALADRREKFEIQILNIFDFINPSVGRFFLNSYYKIIKTVPGLYGLAYRWGNRNSGALWGRELVSSYLADKMAWYIDRINPSAIVCTHATPAGLMSNLVRRGMCTAPVYAVITDFVVHRLWVYPEIQSYFVADDLLKDYLRREGITGSIRVSGIPVHREFAMEYDRHALRTNLALVPAVPTVLIMGGGIGLLPIDKLLNALLEEKFPIQIIVVAGKNRSAYNKARSLAAKAPIPVKVYGYTDNVHELMACSDLIVTKPGGMSSAEAVCMGLPLLIYRPIPGQEEANTNFLLDRQLAIRIDSLTDLTVKLNMLLNNKDIGLEVIRKQMTAARKPRAAEEIAAAIADDLNRC